MRTVVWVALLTGCAFITPAELDARLDRDGDGHTAMQFGGDDCDDADRTVYPGATEIWYDGSDQDCAGDDDYDQDGDGDRFDVFGGQDCDDSDEDIHSGATEVWYDGVDQDCLNDNDYDQDGDGALAESEGGTDCDDLEPDAYPGAIEVDGDNIDNDCDDQVDETLTTDDRDDDGVSEVQGDCDDDDDDVYPGAAEVFYDGVDQDCDPSNEYDRDGDGFDSQSFGGTDLRRHRRGHLPRRHRGLPPRRRGPELQRERPAVADACHCVPIAPSADRSRDTHAAMPSSLTGPTQPRAMLEVVRDGVVATTVPLYAGSLHIGRDMGNDLVLVDADVSNHHAVIVLEGSSARVVDLKSTNGTFLNGRRISESTALVDRDILRFGRTAIARVTVIPIAHQPPPFVMDLTSGLRHAFETDRFTVGSDHGCDLVVPDADALVATLIVHPSGEVWLGSEDAEDAPLELGAEFDLAGHRLRLDPPDLERTPTYRAPTATTWPYHLRVALDLPGGPVATLIDTTRDRRHQVSAENRAVLLYVLARKLVADRAQGVDDALAGWCDDDEVVTGVWGRTGPPALNLLLHRLRKELRAAGFDPWFLEKRKGAVRVRLAAVDLDSSEVS